MKKFISLVVLLAIVVPVSFANAQSKRAARKRPMADEALSGQGYGTAGCGLGSIVFGQKPGYIQIVAATLNGIGGQTFAMSTGTSNCDLGDTGMQAAVFIDTNREVVNKDMARGRGETVESLAYIFRCEDAQLFGNKMKQSYGNVLESGISTYETTRRIMNTIKSTPELKATCGSVG
jgi:hypothetical protein